MTRTHSVFFDEQGEERLVDCFVLFLDLLGSRKSATLAHLKAVRSAVQRAGSRSFVGKGAGAAEGGMQWFSDNVSVGCPIDQADDPSGALAILLTTAGYLQLAFLQDGLPTRGAITRGAFFADETFVYGPALIRAVDLEHKEAETPRCILDEASARAAYAALVGADRSAQNSVWRRYLLCDETGRVFLNYLGLGKEDPAGLLGPLEQHLIEHRDIVLDGLARFDGDPSVSAKYRWMAAYHNHFIDTEAPELVELKAYCARSSESRFLAFGETVAATAEQVSTARVR